MYSQGQHHTQSINKQEKTKKQNKTDPHTTTHHTHKTNPAYFFTGLLGKRQEFKSLDCHFIMTLVSQLDAFCISQSCFNGHKAFSNRLKHVKPVILEWVSADIRRNMATWVKNCNNFFSLKHLFLILSIVTAFPGSFYGNPLSIHLCSF